METRKERPVTAAIRQLSVVNSIPARSENVKHKIVTTASVVLLALSVTGCAIGEGMIVPPDLVLDTGGAAPRITGVTVKNSASEVLFDGKPDDKGFASANPDPSKLDGTLVITSLWSDGPTTTQTLTHEPGKPVKVSLDKDTLRFKVEVQETQKVKKPGVLESLIPALIPPIGVGIGGGRDRGRDSDRSHPK